jgi:hypothetical protein
MNMQCNPLVTVQKTVITTPTQNHKLSQVFTELLQHSSAFTFIITYKLHGQEASLGTQQLLNWSKNSLSSMEPIDSLLCS